MPERQPHPDWQSVLDQFTDPRTLLDLAFQAPAIVEAILRERGLSTSSVRVGMGGSFERGAWQNDPHEPDIDVTVWYSDDGFDAVRLYGQAQDQRLQMQKEADEELQKIAKQQGIEKVPPVHILFGQGDEDPDGVGNMWG